VGPAAFFIASLSDEVLRQLSLSLCRRLEIGHKGRESDHEDSADLSCCHHWPFDVRLSLKPRCPSLPASRTRSRRPQWVASSWERSKAPNCGPEIALPPQNCMVP
jgi:hypothetical protein